MTTRSVRQPTASVTSQVVRLTSASAAAMLLAVALVHLARNSRIEVPPVNSSFGWIASLLIVGLIAIARCAWHRLSPPQRDAETRIVWALASLAALAWSFSLTLIARNFVEILAIWLIVLTNEVVCWSGLLRSTSNKPSTVEPINNPVSNDRRTLAAAFADPDSSELRTGLDDSVVQQLIRSETEEHGELIHGLLRCHFHTGERSKTQHVAFCPPLDTQPSILVDQVNGPAGRIKVGQAESFGSRFEIRLDRTCRRSCDFVFEFFANTCDGRERLHVS